MKIMPVLLSKSKALLRVKNRKCSTQSGSDIINRDQRFVAQNYQPLPVAICKGEGIYLTDVDGKKYMDFFSGSAVNNFGHSHPKIVAALKDQVSILHHVSRHVVNNVLGEFAEKLSTMFGYQKFLPMSTGCEAAETAIKLARKWGYKKKSICENMAKVVFCCGNFHGRTLACISASTDPVQYKNYGPYLPGFVSVPFNDVLALECMLQDPNVCAFMVEPVQGQAGVIVPCTGYLRCVRHLCTKYNVLFIADEVTTGMGRTGKRLACDHECVKPDVICLGKALGGGVYPISGVLSCDDVLSVIEPGTHGSTFGGNPLGAKCGITALDVMEEENICSNAVMMGSLFRDGMQKCLCGKVVTDVRGVGLMNAIAINEEIADPAQICLKLKDAGIIANAANGAIRFMPPLIIKTEEVKQALDVIVKVIATFEK